MVYWFLEEVGEQMRSMYRNATIGFFSLLIGIGFLVCVSAYMDYFNNETFTAILLDKLLDYFLAPLFIGAAFSFLQEIWKLNRYGEEE